MSMNFAPVTRSTLKWPFDLDCLETCTNNNEARQWPVKDGHRWRSKISLCFYHCSRQLTRPSQREYLNEVNQIGVNDVMIVCAISATWLENMTEVD